MDYTDQIPIIILQCCTSNSIDASFMIFNWIDYFGVSNCDCFAFLFFSKISIFVHVYVTFSKNVLHVLFIVVVFLVKDVYLDHICVLFCFSFVCFPFVFSIFAALYAIIINYYWYMFDFNFLFVCFQCILAQPLMFTYHRLSNIYTFLFIHIFQQFGQVQCRVCLRSYHVHTT